MQSPGPDVPLSALIAAADARGAGAQTALFEALYAELHRLAESHVHRAGRHVTLGTTTLLHEAYLEISKREAWRSPTASTSSPTRRAPCAGWSSTTCASATRSSAAAS